MEESLGQFLSHENVYDDATVQRLSNDFSRIQEDCYLDHAGATLYSDSQIKDITADLHRSLYANPHSIGTASSLTQDIIERMRYRILDHFHVSPEEYSVIFTHGATASMKIIAETFQFNENESDTSTGHGRGHFVYTQDNHTSVLGMREVAAERGAVVDCLTHKAAFNIFNHPPSELPKFRNGNLSDSIGSNSLFVYPAQCNFSGLKYPLKWIQYAQNGALSRGFEASSTHWYVLLDAAGFVSTSDLNLSVYKPDFVCLSFYKVFGYPTGIGALLVRNSSSKLLRKIYYGGGTVDVSLSSEMFHVKRPVLHQKFEDGTVPFLSIISLGHGFDVLSKISMNKISKHVFSLARYLHHHLVTMHHANGEPVVQLYSDTDYEDSSLQGGIVSFNLMRANREYIGYVEVLNMASLFKIHLRTGCFCNPGACQRHLDLSNEEVLRNYDAGYVCGGAADLINGKPTGAVRISFGYMSTIKDADTVLHMIDNCFVEGTRIQQIPSWWSDYKLAVREKYKQENWKKSTNYHEPNDIEMIKSSQFENVNGPSTVANGNSSLKLYQHEYNTIGNCDKEHAVLERLFIYPIKSCGAYEIKGVWNLNSKGLRYDREWMVTTSTGACLTQKQCTTLCLIRPVLCTKEKIMRLTYPGMPTIDVPLEEAAMDLKEGAVCRSRVCGHKVEGFDCGSDVSEWLSLVLRRPNLRLIRQANREHTQMGARKSELSFSSQAQYLLINKASVAWLADQIQGMEVQRETIMDRFRANMIITGYPAFKETKWCNVSIGRNNFLVNGPCTRCQMICIDQKTGTKSVEPMRTLAEKFHGKLNFGIYLAKETKEDAVIKIGDAVRVK